jgi:NADH-quinone oxidoreductase subunit L
VLTGVLFQDLVAGGKPLSQTLFTWAATAGFQVDAAFYFDAITAVMCLVVTGIGTLIHIYSIGYMHDDESFSRYFAYLNLFLFFMLVLVLGRNLVVLFVGWEGVGLASYLLIGFWFKDPAKTAAGLKAFVVNRVGDTGFLLAAFLIQFTLARWTSRPSTPSSAATPPSAAVMTAIGLLLLVGACGKSAQIPLHVWLPDAMAGPTPVSALIHAATMVTAGVYLLSRMSGVFLAAPDAMLVVAWLGGITALAGATMGVTEFNLKKVLAYSTMSQIGLMIMACGLGAFSVGMFHLTTHAFFKACLFLGAGAVLHALAGEEDMRKMGGLAKKLPFTTTVFLLATLALCGVPPFAGFFSKDEILWAAWSAGQGSPLLWLVGSAASFLTAFYMFRLVFMTFFGATRVSAASCSTTSTNRRLRCRWCWAFWPSARSWRASSACRSSGVSGWACRPRSTTSWRRCWGTSSRAGVSHSAELMLMLVAIAVALAGIALAWLIYGRQGLVTGAGPPARSRPWSATVTTSTRFMKASSCVHWAGCPARCCPAASNRAGPRQHGPARTRRA